MTTSEYCDNDDCENMATDEVNVTWRGVGDTDPTSLTHDTRSLCIACHEAYTWGVQYGRLSENPRAYEPAAVTETHAVPVAGCLSCDMAKMLTEEEAKPA